MKKIIFLAISLLMFNICSFSQGKYDLITSASLGLTFPGHNMDFYKTGFNLGADVQIPFSRITGIRIDLQYNSIPFDDSKVIGYIEGGRYSLTAFKPNFTIGYLDKKEQTFGYGFIGIGFYFPASSDYMYKILDTLKTSTGGSADLNLGFNIGVRGGYKIKDNLGIFGEFGYNVYAKPDAAQVSGSITYLKVGISYFSK